MKITFEANEKQAQTLMQALELYARIGMGQLHHLHEHPAFQTRNYNLEEADKLMDNLKKEVFEDLHGKGHSYGIRHEKTHESCKEAYDMYQVIRHSLALQRNSEGNAWSVEFDTPTQFSQQPLMKCKIDKVDSTNKKQYQIFIPIGDWSGDGHNQYVEIEIESNYPVRDLQEAYKRSCRLTGLQFNHNENFSGRPEHDKYGTERHICTEYHENYLSDTAINVLRSFNCPFENLLRRRYFEDKEEFTKLLLWFISLSMPKDFKYSFPKRESKKVYLNGFWDSNLNVQFGYGLFS